ncbi:hypothetical protein L218DRAFT_949804 [Marasmius fiardii PR-910]|nr:hypothetical protein L218DRAFT_949804 [Marasmius fiardii PR-910]
MFFCSGPSQFLAFNSLYLCKVALYNQSSSNPDLEWLLQGQVCLKQIYLMKVKGGGGVVGDKDNSTKVPKVHSWFSGLGKLRRILVEANTHYWATMLLQFCYEYIEVLMNDPDANYPKAEFLSGLQHLQSEKMHHMAYVSDFQGYHNLLTDLQVMNSLNPPQPEILLMKIDSPLSNMGTTNMALSSNPTHTAIAGELAAGNELSVLATQGSSSSGASILWGRV